jgi:hypothetical protein
MQKPSSLNRAEIKRIVPPPTGWRRLSATFIILLFLGALAAWYRQSAVQGKCSALTAKSYEVRFKWRGAITDLHAIDRDTGKEEPSKQLRSVIWKESADIIKQISVSSHLDNMDGSFALTLSGGGEPYLTSWNSADIPQLSNFLAAAQEWNTEELREDIAKGMNVNARDLRNHTALMLAASDPRKEPQQRQQYQEKKTWEPSVAAVKLLLSAGADPNANGNYGVTPVMLAADSTASILLRGGANVNVSDDFGKTPLMYMAEKGEDQALKLYLSYHADVNARDRNGWTALMYAANAGSLESLRILLEAGSEIHARNKAGQDALEIAVERAAREPQFRRAVDLLSTRVGHT